METAKVFWSGRSQAVRLPKDFRFDTDEVRIRRHGCGVILEPVAHDWLWLDRLIGPMDEDFTGAESRLGRTQVAPDIPLCGNIVPHHAMLNFSPEGDVLIIGRHAASPIGMAWFAAGLCDSQPIEIAGVG